MAESTDLIKKLQIKPGARLWLVNVPPAIAKLVAAGEGIETLKSAAGCTAILAFAENPAEVEKFGKHAIAALPPDGLLWFAYRKGDAAKKSGLSRDEGWTALADADWRPVRSIAIDNIWTGLRFKPVESVKSKTPDAWRTRGQG
jgi:hypothetical protein